MFAILVGIMLVILIAFVCAWIAKPSFREWIERPKHSMLAREAEFRERDIDRRAK